MKKVFYLLLVVRSIMHVITDSQILITPLNRIFFPFPGPNTRTSLVATRYVGTCSVG